MTSDLEEVIARWKSAIHEMDCDIYRVSYTDLTRLLDAADAAEKARDALRLIDKIATEHRRGAAVEMQAVARRALKGAA